MYNQWDNLHNSYQITNVDRHSPDNSLHKLEGMQDISDSQLDSFLDSLTQDQEPPNDKFTDRQLAVWLYHNSWRSH